CHSQPATGGTSPSVNAFPFVGPNPQVALANENGAANKLPFFVKPNGPIREARFKFVMQNGRVEWDQPDNSVHDLFTIEGRQDAPGCVLAQENFDEAREQNNLALRIPTPTFGDGLIEMTDEATILQNMRANQAAKRALRIGGRPNYNDNDATISRFGWKAQNKSLMLFSHEAYNVELGETNQMFPNKRGFFPNPPPVSCIYNAQPEDRTNMLPLGSDTADVPSDDDQFATFMRLLDQPTPACTGVSCSASIRNGRALFTDVVKCGLCHTPSMTTGNSATTTINPPGLSNVQANLFSDLLLHHMGVGLADGITQGKAGPDQFRTAPLWGVGQRVFFLHDGRTTDLLEAIRQHAGFGSEANGVINLFNQLDEAQKQDLLNFLRSL
ncbi:MAG TPA: di-heme oxidoredictase family protein, partial [Steroidobacteraceae bacterium]|nr:di-heme oxidoredictase family protein [Steroidobacteraceae bacterium]